ncbi:MAG: hypothetical protein FJY74_07580 [Candidatus Eisenbacteria bacterium]|nr:hypothetical protein [Candidatus Eisenbacteria bacterium]
MDEGTYIFFVEHVSGGLFMVDYVSFASVESPVEARSWGSIKAMYR